MKQYSTENKNIQPNQTLIENTLVRLKDLVVRQILASEILEKKISGFMYRNNVPATSQIGEDVKQTVMFHICKYDTNKLMDMFCDAEKPNRITGFIVTLLRFKCFSKLASGYPKHSLVPSILFTSNIQQKSYYDSNEHYMELNESKHILASDDLTQSPEAELWTLIRENLTEEENTFLEDHLYNKKKKQGRFTNVQRVKIQNLHDKIKAILTQNKIQKV